MQWKIALALIVGFFGLMKFIVEYQRASWDRVPAAITGQNETLERLSKRTVSRVCTYSLAFEYGGETRIETKRVETSCNTAHNGQVVLLINPDRPDYFNVDFGLTTEPSLRGSSE